MKPRDRILVLTDLFMGALWADDEFSEDEQVAVRRLLAELLVVDALPPSVEDRIAKFEPFSFDLEACARDFSDDPPVAKRRLLELVGMMADADGKLDIREDQYLRTLATHLGIEYAEHAELVHGIDIAELRESFESLRAPPPPMVAPTGRTSKPPPPPIVPPTHVPRAAPLPSDED